MMARKARRVAGGPVRSRIPAIFAGILVLVLLGIGIAVVLFLLSWARGALARPGLGLDPALPGQNHPSENVEYGFGQLLPTWSGQDRVTVLVLGIDERSQETGPFRTDTMILLTLDPASKQAGALSIPRDLWVPIPGYPEGRINTAHFLGDLYGHEGGGPALAVQTVEYNIGVPIDYYVRINFQGFVTLVNQIGGIDVLVEETIIDPTYPDYNYGYDPLTIEAGWHHFDGEMALKYARTRHGSSDFDRAHRQQQVLLAIMERVTSLNMLPDLARNASKLYDNLQSSVQTDMALDQALALANLALQVDRSTIRLGVIDQTCTQPWVTPNGAQVLVPLRDEMRAVRDYVFAADQIVVEGGTQSNPETVLPTPTPELASVAVLNGTTRAGLAGSTADYLKAEGIDVAQVGNAEGDYASTLIVVYRDRPLTVSRLVKLLSLTPASVIEGAESDATYDIVVVVGDDYTGPPQN